MQTGLFEVISKLQCLVPQTEKKIIDLVSRNSTSGQDDPYGFILSWNSQCSCRAFSNNRKYLSRLITIIVSICQDVLRKIKMLLKAYEHNLYFRSLINVYIFFVFFSIIHVSILNCKNKS